MDANATAIISVLVLIFALEGVFPHYQGRAARVRHGLPHVITAILNSLITKFALVLVTLAALGRAEASSIGLANALPLPATTKLIFVFVLFDIWMYFWHMANHRIGFFWRFHRL